MMLLSFEARPNRLKLIPTLTSRGTNPDYTGGAGSRRDNAFIRTEGPSRKIGFAAMFFGSDGGPAPVKTDGKGGEGPPIQQPPRRKLRITQSNRIRDFRRVFACHFY